METKKSHIIFIVVFFIIINSFFISKELYWFTLFPIFALLAYLYFKSFSFILLLITFLTPISINLSDYDAQIGLSIPTEPMMAVLAGLFIFKVFKDFEYDQNVLKHPVTISIVLYLLWMFITSITSEIPLVSFKFLIAKLWFIIPFYFLATQVFKNIRNFKLFSWMYMVPLIGVIIYTTIKHYSYNFDEKVGHWIMDPFYNDHTAYGAMIAFFIPVITGFLFDKGYNVFQRFFTFFAFLILTLGLILSYSRAAWLGIFAAFILAIILKFKIKIKYVVLSLSVLLALFFLMKNEILMKLENNKQDTSGKITEHIQSISNISTDASNLERINRWESAIRMFFDRPFFGFGPGTYQFCYAPYQFSYEKTIISTNAGNRGNAHSEYIGPLAESGFLGLITVLLIVITTSYTAIKVYNRSKNKKVKLLSLLSMLALTTYFVHGFLNNFLDTDKASVPYWGFIAMIVALDLYHKNELKDEKE